jgi:hypothetical protein
MERREECLTPRQECVNVGIQHFHGPRGQALRRSLNLDALGNSGNSVFGIVNDRVRQTFNPAAHHQLACPPVPLHHAHATVYSLLFQAFGVLAVARVGPGVPTEPGNPVSQSSTGTLTFSCGWVKRPSIRPPHLECLALTLGFPV